MKITGIMSIYCVASFVITGTSIYSYSVPTIEGGSQGLSAYQGKRMLIVTLPIQQTVAADSFLYSLDTLASAHSANFKVIGVPSYEDGYTVSQRNQLQQWYRSKLNTNITITEGLYTRRTSGTQQHGLFKWLTDPELNESFDIDVTGPNFKFFVKEDGGLYGVIESLTKISSGAVYKTLSLQ